MGNIGQAKILVFDIETTHLKADFGTVLCIGYKWLGEKKTTVISITDSPDWKLDVTDDGKVLAKFYPILVEADIWVTYFGTGFDRPYIQSKLLEHRLDFLPNTPHVDLYYTVKSNLSLSRKSLANVGTFLGCTAQKTPVTGKIWKQAMVGKEDAIRYVVTHCKADVNLTEEVYQRLKPLARVHPYVGKKGNCRQCGSDKLQFRGRYVATHVGEQHRVQCQNCGSWGRIKK